MCIALYITLHTGPPNKVSDWNVETKWKHCRNFRALLGFAVTTGYPNLQSPGPEGWPVACVNLFIHCHIASAHLFVCLCWSKHIASSRVIAIDPTRASWDCRLMFLKAKTTHDSISISWTSQDSKWMQPETEAEELSGHRINNWNKVSPGLTITYSDAVMRLLS